MPRGSISSNSNSRTWQWTSFSMEWPKQSTPWSASWPIRLTVSWPSIQRSTNTYRNHSGTYTMSSSRIRMANIFTTTLYLGCQSSVETLTLNSIKISRRKNKSLILIPSCTWETFSISSGSLKFNKLCQMGFTSKLPQGIASPLSWWSFKAGVLRQL